MNPTDNGSNDPNAVNPNPVPGAEGGVQTPPAEPMGGEQVPPAAPEAPAEGEQHDPNAGGGAPAA